MKRTKYTAGYSLIEIMLVMAISALFMTLAFPMFGYFREKAGFAGCVSHLRIIHVGLNTYMIDHEMVWPQVPDYISGEEVMEYKWWDRTLKDYGVASKHWVCPSDNSISEEEKAELKDGEVYGSYMPTLFDSIPNTAFRWKQPWVIERGAFHGDKRGPNLLMPDGSVQEGPAFMGL